MVPRAERCRDRDDPRRGNVVVARPWAAQSKRCGRSPRGHGPGDRTTTSPRWHAGSRAPIFAELVGGVDASRADRRRPMPAWPSTTIFDAPARPSGGRRPARGSGGSPARRGGDPGGHRRQWRLRVGWPPIRRSDLPRSPEMGSSPPRSLPADGLGVELARVTVEARAAASNLTGDRLRGGWRR